MLIEDLSYGAVAVAQRLAELAPRALVLVGASFLLAKIAIGDWLTAVVGIVSLAILFRFKVSNPLLIGATAVVGLVAFPMLQPTWVFVQ